VVDVTGVVQYGRTYRGAKTNPLFIRLGIWLGVLAVLAAVAFVVVSRMRMQAALAALPRAEAEKEEVDLDKFGVVRHQQEKKPIVVRIEPPKDE